MRKKIAFVTPIYLPAPLYGSDNAVRILAEDLVTAGYNVTVITSDAATPRYWYDPFFGKKISPDAPRMINGVHVIRLSSNQLIASLAFVLSRFLGQLLLEDMRGVIDILSNGPYLMGLDVVLKKEAPDVIHCSPFPLNINRQVVRAIVHLKQKPMLILTPFFHASVSSYHNRALGAVIQRADVIHAISFAEKKDMEAFFPESKGKITVLPLYLRTEVMHTSQALEKDILMFKKKYAIEGKKIVLLAGLKGRMKGALDTLRVVQEYAKKDNSVVLVAIGHNTSEWNEMLRTLNDTDFLRDFSYVDEREKEIIFASCDVFCMPSISETFGYVYLEAWHKKKPVIGADISAMRELIQASDAGLLVPYGNLRDIQSAIERLINDSALSKTLGEHGQKALIDKYSMKSVFPQYRKMFIV